MTELSHVLVGALLTVGRPAIPNAPSNMWDGTVVPRFHSETYWTAGVARTIVWLWGRTFENDRKDAVASWVWY